MAAILEASPGVEIIFRRATASYAVFHYRFRDLLALRFSHANLLANGCPPDRVHACHQTSPDRAGLQDADLVVGMLRPKEPPESTAPSGGWFRKPLGVAGSCSARVRQSSRAP